jgi:hypothetical protein
VDDLESGEKRLRDMEIALTKAVSSMTSSIENMPNTIELIVIKAINTHYDNCKTRLSISPTKSTSIWASHAGKIIAALLAALTSLLGYALTK